MKQNTESNTQLPEENPFKQLEQKQTQGALAIEQL